MHWWRVMYAPFSYLVVEGLATFCIYVSLQMVAYGFYGLDGEVDLKYFMNHNKLVV